MVDDYLLGSIAEDSMMVEVWSAVNGPNHLRKDPSSACIHLFVVEYHGTIL